MFSIGPWGDVPNHLHTRLEEFLEFPLHFFLGIGFQSLTDVTKARP
jgi:hypothetical protein